MAFTQDNRHQYLQTAVVGTAEFEHEIMAAEARGRARQACEVVLKHRVQTVGNSLVVMAIDAIAGVAV